MKKKALPEKYIAKIKAAAESFDKEKAFVDTAVFRIKGEFYGYQPYEQKYKKKYESIPNSRLEKIRSLLLEFEENLKKDGIDLLFCYVSVEEGGAIINFGSEAIKMKDFVMQELKELEEKHAQIS